MNPITSEPLVPSGYPEVTIMDSPNCRAERPRVLLQTEFSGFQRFDSLPILRIMRKHRTIFTGLLVAFAILILGSGLQAQTPTVTINFNTRNLVPGSTIDVPVVINGNQVGNWQILIKYDHDVLTYLSTDNTVSGMGLYNAMDNYMGLGYSVFKAALAYFGGAPGYNYANQAVITIHFTYKGGGTNFTFVNLSTLTSQTGPTFTYLKTYPANLINLSTVFTNGLATGVLHSATAGGKWKNRTTWVENVKPNDLCDIQITGNEVEVDSAAACTHLTVEENAILKVNQGIPLVVKGNLLLKSDPPQSAIVDPGNGIIRRQDDH